MVTEDELVRLANEIGPQMSNRVFYAFAPKFALTVIETVLLQNEQGVLKVLLVQRPDDDELFAGAWHSPGTILRASDAPDELGAEDPYAAAFERMQRAEFGIPFRGKPIFAGTHFHKTRRGPESSLIFICTLADHPKNGVFFPVDHLPESLVEHHRKVIEIAVAAYVSHS